MRLFDDGEIRGISDTDHSLSSVSSSIPESIATEYGHEMMGNFIAKIKGGCMKYFIEKLISKQDLNDGEMGSAFDTIMSGGANDTLIGAFSGLEGQGEKPSEIASAARIMREKAVRSM